MALPLPRPLEPAWESLLTRLTRRAVQPQALGLMVERMSRRYLGEKVELARGDELVARTRFWFPRDVHKVARPVFELVRAGALPDRPLRVLDVGAGLGATSLGLLRALGEQHAAGVRVPRVELLRVVDQDAEVLELLRQLAEQATAAGLLPGPLPTLETRAGDLTEPAAFAEPTAPFDLVLVGSALVEVTRALGDEEARGAAIAAHLARLIETAPLAPDGTLLVIEPATRPETRALHRARAALIEQGYAIFAPCTHPGVCPMLARERDWCHEDLPVDLPPWLVPVAREAGLRWQGLTFSYLVVQRAPGRSVGEVLRAPDLVPVRLVSAPRVSKGKTEAFACGPFPGESTGPRVMQLDRDTKGLTKDALTLARCARGDVVGLSTETAAQANESGSVRVGADGLRPTE
jgi:SAM-dependent methyltransferase